jgi:hypothetical protein
MGRETYTPRIRHYKQDFFRAVNRLAPRTLASIQLACFSPRLDVCGTVLQQHRHSGNSVLCPSQRLEHGDPSLAHAHVGRVFAQYLLVAFKHLFEIRV